MAAAAPAALDCWGALEEEALTGVVATALGRPVTLAGFTCVPVAYQPGSPATGALLRVSGTTGDGEPWSVFLKVLHHPRHWPRIGDVPAEIRQQFLDQFPWRGELVAWEPGFADRLPAGMRLPRLYRLAELGDDRVAVWMEDVRVLDGAWDPPRFARAAHALGGLAARRADPELLAACVLPVGWGLRSYNSSRVQLVGLPMLERDEVWAHPLLAGAVDGRLRDDLRALGARVPELLDRMDGLPRPCPTATPAPRTCSCRPTPPTPSWPSTCRSRLPRRSGSTSASCWSA
jgi:hypothetical protein